MLVLTLALLACKPAPPDVFTPDENSATHPHAVGRVAYDGPPDGTVKNIILVIGDGMAIPAITAGLTANRNQLWLESFEVIGLQKTQSANNWVTDSSAAATAMATGHKTNNGAVGVDANDEPVDTIIELAERQGLATGLVVTSEITHGTPAGFSAHVPSRRDEFAIADQMATQGIDVMIGSGRIDFDKRPDGRDIVGELEKDGYTIAADLAAITATKTMPMVGFIAEDQAPYRVDGRAETLRLGTEKAMELLSSDDAGFFLLVEGSQIDWGGHENNLTATVTETLDMDETLQSILRFALATGDTLVIVTADHETGGLTLHKGDMEEGTLQAKWATSGHTGHMVPVFAWGPQAHRFAGIYENTDLFHRMVAAYGWSTESAQDVHERPPERELPQ